MTTLQIKRGNTTPTIDDLSNGELGFDKNSNILYIGNETEITRLSEYKARIYTYDEYKNININDIEDDIIYLCTDPDDKIVIQSTAYNQLGITATDKEINTLKGIKATTDELNYVGGVISSIQNQLNNRAELIHYHDGENINSGILEIPKGGTGVSSFSEFALKIYPIGSIYISVINTSPASLFGGTWTEWGAGKVPVGINTNDTNFNTIEKTGGTLNRINVAHTHSQVAHTHTVGNNSASHKHTVTGAAVTSGSNSASHTHGTGASNFVFNTHRDIGLDAVGRQTVGSGGSYYALTSTTSSYISQRASTGTQSANHTHSVPTHAHTVGNNSASHTHAHSTADGATTTGSTGVAASAKNLQPYITCYMWKRTA